MWQSFSMHILCINVDITCRYNILVHFFAQQNVCKSPVTCFGFKGHSEVFNKQGACKGKRGVEKWKFLWVRTKWMLQDCLHYFLCGIQRNVSRAECTNTWESRPSKDHQCLYWLSCAVKVLMKNAKVSYFYNSQRKKTNHEPATH